MSQIPTKSTAKAKRTQRFDGLTQVFHWTTVLLVLALFASALSIDRAPTPELSRILLTMHRSLGVTTWLVVLLRLIWRLTGMKLPPFPGHMSGFHRFGVHLSENAMYLLLLVQPLTGLGDTLLHGRPFKLFSLDVPALLPRMPQIAVPLHLAHMTGAYLLAGVVLLHACAGLFHGFVLRDGVLRSMTPGR